MTTIEEIRAGATRSRRWGWWYVAEERLRAMRGYSTSLIVTSFGNPLVYLFALGVGLATLVPAGIDGVSFLQFVAPALMMSTAVTVAAEESMYPVMMGFKWTKIFFGFNATPITPGQIVGGMITTVIIRVVATVSVFFGITVAFGAVPVATIVPMLVIATLTCLAVAAPLIAYTATLTNDTGQLAMIQRFVIMPMFLFSATFFPLTQLPAYLQWIGWVSPLWHGSQLARVLSYGMAEPLWVSIGHVVMLLAFVVVGAVLGHRVFVRRLTV